MPPVIIITVFIHQVRQQLVDGGPCLLVLGLRHGQQAIFNVVGEGCSGCDGLLLGFGEVLDDGAGLTNSLL